MLKSLYTERGNSLLCPVHPPPFPLPLLLNGPTVWRDSPSLSREPPLPPLQLQSDRNHAGSSCSSMSFRNLGAPCSLKMPSYSPPHLLMPEIPSGRNRFQARGRRSFLKPWEHTVGDMLTSMKDRVFWRAGLRWRKKLWQRERGRKEEPCLRTFCKCLSSCLGGQGQVIFPLPH